MLIYLLRHGLTQENLEKRYQGRRDVPLCPQGLAQLRRADVDGLAFLMVEAVHLAADPADGGSAFPRCGTGCGRRAEGDGLWRV